MIYFIEKQSLNINRRCRKKPLLFSKSRSPRLNRRTIYYKESRRLWVTKWWISSFIGGSYTKVHIWLLLESILLAQPWCMWAVFWCCCWMMTWGNGLEARGEMACWKKKGLFADDGASLRHWGFLSAGEPGIKAEQEPWPFISGYFYAFSFMTADWVTVILQNLSLSESRPMLETQQRRTAVNPQKVTIRTSCTLLQCL